MLLPSAVCSWGRSPVAKATQSLTVFKWLADPISVATGQSFSKAPVRESTRPYLLSLPPSWGNLSQSWLLTDTLAFNFLSGSH